MGAAFVVLRRDGKLLVRTRPARGLLGGMTEVPTTAWTEDFDMENVMSGAPSETTSANKASTKASSDRLSATAPNRDPVRNAAG